MLEQDEEQEAQYLVHVSVQRTSEGSFITFSQVFRYKDDDARRRINADELKALKDALAEIFKHQGETFKLLESPLWTDQPPRAHISTERLSEQAEAVILRALIRGATTQCSSFKLQSHAPDSQA